MFPVFEPRRPGTDAKHIFYFRLKYFSAGDPTDRPPATVFSRTQLVVAIQFTPRSCKSSGNYDFDSINLVSKRIQLYYGRRTVYLRGH
jgi:hypothetical protein